MQVVICDDDMGCCEEIKEWLVRYSVREAKEIAVTIFYSAEELLCAMEKGQWFDVIFLDIEFPDMDGVVLGEKIREIAQNDVVTIIYISGKTEYCPELFEMEPINFHQKPLKEEYIAKDMDKIIERYEVGKNVFTYKEEGVTKGILLRDILYIKSKDKFLELVTKDGTSFMVKGVLQDIHKKYEKYHLYQCHRSYVINMNYVKRYYNYKLHLDDEIEIEVGRKYRDRIKEAWAEYDWRD